MELITYPDAAALLDRIGPVFEVEEAKHSLILGILSSFESRSYRLEGTPMLAVVENAGDIVAAAVMTPPFPLILAAVGDRISSRAIHSIAEYLWTARHSVSGITAGPWVAPEFADIWERMSGRTQHAEMQQRIYRLERGEIAPTTEGVLRPATSEDVDLVARWMMEFDIEVAHKDERTPFHEVAAKRIGQGEIYLWEDSGPQCMVGRSRPTRATITVNSVYTPPELRGRGYATAAVRALSRLLLEEGFRACVLYTDLADPTSNRIYVRIGYEPVSDSVRYLFAP